MIPMALAMSYKRYAISRHSREKNCLSTLQSIDLLLHVYIVIKNETTPRLIQHMLHILFTDSIMSFRAKNKTQFINKNR